MNQLLDSDNPWMTASERLCKYARMDRSLCGQLSKLSEQQASQNKLAYAIEAGRTFGMRQPKYDHILQRQVAKQWRHPPLQPHW